VPIFYRGIALDQQTADAACAAIRQSGQLAAKSWWKNTMASPPQVRSRTSELARVPSKVRAEIGNLPPMPLTYACGDFEGAARYALRGGGIPAVVTFQVALEEVILMGRTSSIRSSSSGIGMGLGTGTGCAGTFRPCSDLP
jgi:hypothetical protein